MRKSKIEWCDHTWNPVTGCRHGCSYCYAKTMTARFAGDVRRNLLAKDSYRTEPARDFSGELYVLDEPMLNETGSPLVYPFGFRPTFHRYRLGWLDKLKAGSNVFAGAMADIFGAWVPDRWIDEVMAACREHPRNNYLFLTKNPIRYEEYGVPMGENFWYGTSVTREEDMIGLRHLPDGANTFVSFEPLLEEVEPAGWHRQGFDSVNWVIIGAETGNVKGKVIPDVEWIWKIVKEADTLGIPVFMKDSLIPVVGEERMRRNFPEKLGTEKQLSPKMDRKLYDSCYSCGERRKKTDMAALMARSRRGETPKQFAFLCPRCFKEMCERLGAELPDLEILEENTDGKRDEE